MTSLIEKWKARRRERNFKKEFDPLIFEKKIGMYPFGCLLDDPELESAFLNWVEARVKMARKPGGSTWMWLHLQPLGRQDPPVNGEIWKQLDHWTLLFEWKDYPAKKEDIRGLFLRARERNAGAIAVVLINSGDAMQELLRRKAQERNKKGEGKDGR